MEGGPALVVPPVNVTAALHQELHHLRVLVDAGLRWRGGGPAVNSHNNTIQRNTVCFQLRHLRKAATYHIPSMYFIFVFVFYGVGGGVNVCCVHGWLHGVLMITTHSRQSLHFSELHGSAWKEQ